MAFQGRASYPAGQLRASTSYAPGLSSEAASKSEKLYRRRPAARRLSPHGVFESGFHGVAPSSMFLGRPKEEATSICHAVLTTSRTGFPQDGLGIGVRVRGIPAH